MTYVCTSDAFCGLGEKGVFLPIPRSKSDCQACISDHNEHVGGLCFDLLYDITNRSILHGRRSCNCVPIADP